MSSAPIGVVVGIGLGIAFLVVLIFAMIRSYRESTIGATTKSVAIDALTQELQTEITVVTGASVPGATVERVIGLVRGMSETQASTKQQFELAEKEALRNMLQQAKRLGAKAILDTRLSASTYEQQGSKWQVSQIVYTGTAVMLGASSAGHS
ncbi:heavy metal-binding domain-containing protein [Solimonas soli]|uniref:heavy metal-binding domain-containing protein n=1 Tax=Solimonas soli TaxID=413479 RepID=UPI00048283F9|nr:heavy metal-binding domain-containing protein [Solimonas soli]